MSTAPDQRPPRYRLFLDESGDHCHPLADEPGRRYLALLGVWFRMPDKYNAFCADLREFKRGIFGAEFEITILHRSDIVNRRGPYGQLRDPRTRAKFDAGLLGVRGGTWGRYPGSDLIINSLGLPPSLRGCEGTGMATLP